MPEEDRPPLEAPAAPDAVVPDEPALTRMSSSAGGGWGLFGRLLIWAMRNKVADQDRFREP